MNAEQKPFFPQCRRQTGLARGELLGLPGRSGARLRILCGRVLVTQTGVAEDFDLAAGAVLLLPVTGKLVVEALDDAEMEISSPRSWWRSGV